MLPNLKFDFEIIAIIFYEEDLFYFIRCNPNIKNFPPYNIEFLKAIWKKKGDFQNAYLKKFLK